MNKSKLKHETIDRKQNLFSTNSPVSETRQILLTSYIQHPTSFLLSVYDEYFIGYKDRSEILEEKYSKNMASVGNALLTSLIITNGKVEGTWKRILKKDHVEIKLNLFTKPTTYEKSTIKEASRNYGNFLGLNVKTQFTTS